MRVTLLCLQPGCPGVQLVANPLLAGQVALHFEWDLLPGHNQLGTEPALVVAAKMPGDLVAVPPQEPEQIGWCNVGIRSCEDAVPHWYYGPWRAGDVNPGAYAPRLA